MTMPTMNSLLLCCLCALFLFSLVYLLSSLVSLHTPLSLTSSFDPICKLEIYQATHPSRTVHVYFLMFAPPSMEDQKFRRCVYVCICACISLYACLFYLFMSVYLPSLHPPPRPSPLPHHHFLLSLASLYVLFLSIIYICVVLFRYVCFCWCVSSSTFLVPSHMSGQHSIP